MYRIIRISLLVVSFGLSSQLSVSAADYFTGVDVLKQDDRFLTSTEGLIVLDNLLTYQKPCGGWCKGYNAHFSRSGDNVDQYGGWHGTPTIDNGATYSEVAVLAKAAQLASDDNRRKKYQQACQRGIEFLLSLQYQNGGWPQRPPKIAGANSYGVHITFNDDAMTNVLSLLLDVQAQQKEVYAFLSPELIAMIATAIQRGVDNIIQCQIILNGQPTVWCQQHDSVSLRPAQARAYELPSLSGGESAQIILLLMRLKNPDARVCRAIRAGHAWYQKTKITQKSWKSVKDLSAPNGIDKQLIDDTSASGLWARYYDIETGQPYFCDRDGVKVLSVKEISHERRNGYAWYGTWGRSVIESFPAWEQRDDVMAVP